MDSTLEQQINFTKTVVVQKIIANNPDFANQKLLNVDIKSNNELNGFMSSIIFMQLDFEDERKK